MLRVQGLEFALYLSMYHEVNSLLDHVVALNRFVAACAPDVIVAISGHGFLIASDSLTKHPSAPGIQPGDTISNLNHGQGVSKRYHSAPQCLSRRQLSRP